MSEKREKREMKKENINKYRNAGCDDVNTILFFCFFSPKFGCWK